MCNSQSKRGKMRNYFSKAPILLLQYTVYNSIDEKRISELWV